MRIKDKIDEVEKYLDELEQIIPQEISIYLDDFKTKAACERYFERILESVVSLAFLVIKEKKYKIPEEDKQAFDILASEGIISGVLAEKLKQAKGMRNILAHEYGKVDDIIVFESITQDIMDDVKEFIKKVRAVVKC